MFRECARCRAPNCAQIQWCESERMHPMPQPLVSHRLSCSPKLPPYAGALHGTLGHGEADWPKASPGSLDSSQKPGSSEGLSCRRLVFEQEQCTTQCFPSPEYSARSLSLWRPSCPRARANKTSDAFEAVSRLLESFHNCYDVLPSVVPLLRSMPLVTVPQRREPCAVDVQG